MSVTIQHRPPTAQPEQVAEVLTGAGACIGAPSTTGAERTCPTRRASGVNISDNLSWLRQEENQYLAVPPEVARDLPMTCSA